MNFPLSFSKKHRGFRDYMYITFFFFYNIPLLACENSWRGVTFALLISVFRLNMGRLTSPILFLCRTNSVPPLRILTFSGEETFLRVSHWCPFCLGSFGNHPFYTVFRLTALNKPLGCTPLGLHFHRNKEFARMDNPFGLG